MSDKAEPRLRLEGEKARQYTAIKEYYGVTTDTELMRILITKEYDRLKPELEKNRFEHINVRDQGALIIDHMRDDYALILFKDGSAYCDKDKTDTCVHIDYALTVSKIKEILKEKGWKNNANVRQEEGRNQSS